MREAHSEMAAAVETGAEGSLFLGTEAFALSKGGLESLGCIRRLSCLMTKEEEDAWLAFAEGLRLEPPRLSFIAPTPEDNSGSPLVARSPMADEDAFAPFAPAVLSQAAQFLHDALSKGGSVYVHCSQGVSRNATVVRGLPTYDAES